MKNSVSITFFLRGTRLNAKGEVPVYARVTVNSRRINASTGIFVEPSKWMAGKARIKGNSESTRAINTSLDNKQTAILKFINHLEAEGKQITPQLISNFLQGKEDEKEHTLMEVFDYHNARVKNLIGQDFTESTYRKYIASRKKLTLFIQYQYKQNDISLSELNHAFISNYDMYLRSVNKMGNNSAAKQIKYLRKIVRLAVQNDWLVRDPFINFKIKLKETNRTFLTAEELHSIQYKEITINRIAQIRDVFIFSCYTGLSYSDISKLTLTDITIGIDGEKWIITNRTKTGTRSPIPLLPDALEILQRYSNNPVLIAANKLLPVISNQKTNAFLKEIAAICGISKNLTFHMARHTFATTVTLTNSVPIETVSKMLGHTSIKTTQIYSKVVDTKISNDMAQLKARLYPSQKMPAKIIKTNAG